ncbi:heavy metal-associated isoprenylated plant protein 23 [Quercus suber]|uniref:Heavy metal-associated isoprenylated plant protein 23 n=1 Tax=Quercus suber TaxID=58331 RepID=A0AAW0L3Z6_QUESU
MGVGGTLEYFSDLMSSGHNHKKKKQLQTVELKVRMDCDGCELKVKKALSSLSEADHNRAASDKLDPNFDVAASLQSAKYFPDTFNSLG